MLASTLSQPTGAHTAVRHRLYCLPSGLGQASLSSGSAVLMSNIFGGGGCLPCEVRSVCHAKLHEPVHVCVPISLGSVLCADEVNALVFDVGGCTCKAGYAGDDAPKAVFSSVGIQIS